MSDYRTDPTIFDNRPLDPHKLARICLAQPQGDRFFFLNSLREDVAEVVQEILIKATGTNAADAA